MSDVYTPTPLTPFEKQLQEEERALVEENKLLRAALEPFAQARVRQWWKENEGGNPEITLVATKPFSDGDCFYDAYKRARTALGETE